MSEEAPVYRAHGGIAGALAARYALPEWVLAFEVENGTGGRGDRRADALALNCWASRGLALHGFEIKAVRRVVDWARTAHGGRQYELFAPEGPTACMRWGLCEV